MKKTLFLFLLVISVQAQGWRMSLIVNPQQTYLLNRDDIKAGDSLDLVTTRRFAGGIGVSYGLFDRVFVGADILYSQEGQKYKGFRARNKTTFEGFVELNYIKLPLYFQLSYPVSPKIHLNLYGGPQLWGLVGGVTTMYEYDSTGKKIIDVFADKDSIKIVTIIPSIFGTGLDTFRLAYPFSRVPHNILMIGLWGGVGVGVNVTKRLSADLNLRVDYAITDNEAKETTRDQGNGDIREVWAVKPRFNDNETPDGFKAKDRPKTHNFTLGLQLRLNYRLK